ncbi:hypothetical protein TWF481_009161 [Arthrobotrys musiformis]|uniref:AA1-like domain-containing protein n=1 Tax=Arthrobotrys musiformis TaxID=47236 RepID=A0AAV9W4N4_9PEZI
MKALFTILFTILALLAPSIAYGPFEVQKFEYYVSLSRSRVSYSSFTFYDGTSGISTECKYKAPRSYNIYDNPSPLPTNFTSCDNKDVEWKYQPEGQIIYVKFGYFGPSDYVHEPDWIAVLANGTVIPTVCSSYGYSGYLCTPRETRYLTDFVISV